MREVPISALEHWSYCPRQCGLIHVEQTYEGHGQSRTGGDAQVRGGSRVKPITYGRLVPLMVPPRRCLLNRNSVEVWLEYPGDLMAYTVTEHVGMPGAVAPGDRAG